MSTKQDVDAETQAYRNTMEGMFSSKGVDELAPPPKFDYRGYKLEEGEVHVLMRRVTEALIVIEDKTGRFRYSLPDGRIIDSISWNFWEWPQAVGLNGLFDYYVLISSSDPDSEDSVRTLQILKDWYNARLAEGIPTKNINTMAVLYSVANLVELDQKRGGSVLTPEEKERFEGWMEDWGSWCMRELPRTEMGGFQHITFRNDNHNQLWDDTLVMTVLPLTKIGLVWDRKDYIEEAKYQFIIHIQYLMDSQSGLWYHGWDFDGKEGGHNFARSLWGRGNCWVTLAIPMFLDLLNLPSSDPTFRHLLATFTRQVDGLLPLQDPETGLWRTLLDDKTSYVETSATAGFVGGILLGVRLGYLTKEKYLEPALNGLKACIAQVQDDGQVANVSKGTPVSMDLAFYKDIPRVAQPYGQSLLIIALGEWLRLKKEGII